MNVYYKIIELSKLITDLQNKGANTKPFISPELTIGLLLTIFSKKSPSSISGRWIAEYSLK